MNQFVLTKTIIARRRRLRVRRLKYTCNSNSHHLTTTLATAGAAVKGKETPSEAITTALHEISVLLAATSPAGDKNDYNNSIKSVEGPENDVVDGRSGVEKRISISCGTASSIGGRKEMEDAVAVELAFAGEEYDFFGVYDGHGGACVAEACKEQLHKLLAEEMMAAAAAEEEEWEGVMERCFGRMDGMVVVEEQDRMVGSTAVVAVVVVEKMSWKIKR